MVVELLLGHSVQELLDKSPVKISSDCSERLGLCYHDFDFPFSSAALPVVSIRTEHTTLNLDHVVAFSVLDNDKRIQGRLESVRLTLRGVPSRSDVPVAKQFAYGIIHKILDTGWAKYVFPDEPRIAGRESVNLPDCRKVFGYHVLVHPCFDPLYEMSDQQWLGADSFYNWYFYRDGYYLRFKAWRSRDQRDPPGQASYLFNVEVKSEQEFWLLHFKNEDKVQWKALLPALLEKYRLRREEIETQVERTGIEINRSYQDPPISALEH